MNKRSVSIVAILVLFVGVANGAPSRHGQRNWTWTNPKTNSATKFQAVLIRAEKNAVIVGALGKGKKPHLRQIPRRELSDTDLIYTQKWQANLSAGRQAFDAARKGTNHAQRIELYKESADKHDFPRAANHIGCSRAVFGDYEEAREYFDRCRRFYSPRLPFVPSFATAFAAIENNIALTQIRQRKHDPAVRVWAKLGDRIDDRYPVGIRHNYQVFEIYARGLDGKKISGTAELKERIEEGVIAQIPVNPRLGWLYMPDDGDGSNLDGMFDRICNGCNGAGTLDCKNCTNGKKRVQGFRTITVKGKPQKVPYTKWVTCSTCKGKTQLDCRGCDGHQRQNGKTAGRLFRR